MSDPARAARAKRLLEKHASELAAVRLARHEPPRVGPQAPAEPERKYPALQALAALRQDIHDEFSRSQLELLEVKARLEADIAVLDAVPAPAGPARTETAPTPAAAAPDETPAARREQPAAGKTPPPAKAAPEKEPQTKQPPPAPAPAPRAEPAAGPTPKAAGALKYWPAGLALAALCAAALLFFRPGPAGQGFSLPPSDAAGLCLDADGSRLYFFDPLRQLLVTVSVPGRRVENLSSFQAPGLRALAFDGSAFWAADGAALNRYPAGSAYPADAGYKTGPGLLSLSWDAGRLWAAYSDGRLVRYAAGDRPAPEAVFKAPVGVQSWLAVSGGRLWALEAGSGRLSRYAISVSPALEASADVGRHLPRGEVAGFAVGGGAAWVITGEHAELVRLDLGRLKLSADGK